MNKKENFIQVIKFALIGILNTALDYFLFLVFFGLLHVDKSLAQVFATGLAMVNSYLFNRYWTFGQKGGVRAGEIWKFIIVNLVSMGVTILCLNLFYDILHLEQIANAMLAYTPLSFRLSGDSAVMFCKLVAVPFSLAVNFLGNRLWVFGKKSGEKEQNVL